jgi:hypothetical protein
MAVNETVMTADHPLAALIDVHLVTTAQQK